MFKNLFKKSYEDTFLKVAEVAFDKKNYLSEIFQPLETDNQYELFIFNSVMATSYMLNNKVIPVDEKLLSRFQGAVCVFAERIKKLPSDHLLELIYDRFEKYAQELNLVANSQFSKNEHFPRYFFRRVYHHPLELNEMPTINKWDEEYYEGSLLLDIYKHQVMEVKQGVAKIL